MKHLDLFSGIGGFALATEMAYSDTEVEHTFCDIEPFSRAILKKHWPNAPIHDDIRTLNGKEIGAVDLLTGGFPCQPFSAAGKRKGTEDDRDLWPEMLRVIKETRPTWILGENVAGFINMELDRSLSDLENEAYAVQAFVIPACATEAPHRRDRVWIVAHDESERREEGRVFPRVNRTRESEAYKKWADFRVQHIRGNTFEFEKEDEHFICGMDDGVSHRVDRLKGLGNAIVPQVAAQIIKAMNIA